MTTLKLKGSTRDVMSCDKCGRTELSGTMILVAVNEADEEYGDRMYYGTSCAATSLKISASQLRQAVAGLDRQRIQQAHEQALSAWMKRRIAWMNKTGGTASRYEFIEAAPNMNGHMGLTPPCAVCVEFAEQG